MVELFECAEELGVQFFTGNIPNTVSFSMPGYVVMDYSLYNGGALERCVAAHELGHNARYAFYTRNDPVYIRRRCENQANKWAIKKLVPKDELDSVIENGITDISEIADYFRVTEEFAYMAMWYYRYGNLSIEKLGA